MRRTAAFFMVALSFLVLLSGCGQEITIASEPTSEEEQTDRISFSGEQLYAVAFVGYDDLTQLPSYLENYTQKDSVPVHYFSAGEYYLVIPRYSDIDVKLYKNDMTTDTSSLVFEESGCQPFLIQCNISDIFSDVTICFIREEEAVSFSPYISLKDGAVEVGDRGLVLQLQNNSD